MAQSLGIFLAETEWVLGNIGLASSKYSVVVIPLTSGDVLSPYLVKGVRATLFGEKRIDERTAT
jgi:hypothetical protein